MGYLFSLLIGSNIMRMRDRGQFHFRSKLEDNLKFKEKFRSNNYW